MAESEERPSKIRKLNASDGPVEALQGGLPSIDAASPQMAVEADNDGEDSKVSQVPSTTNDPPLSRNQLKKLRRQQQWEASKEFRKDKRKTLHREKQARKAEAKKVLDEKIAKGEIKRSEITKPKVYYRPVQTPISFVLDCDFNELMTEKEIISLSAQITRSYSDNKTNPYRAHLAISSWGGPLKDRFENVLSSTHLSWKGIKFFEGDFVAAAKEMDGIMRGPEGGRLVGAFAKTESGSDFRLKSEVSTVVETTIEVEGKLDAVPEDEASRVEAEGLPEPAHEIPALDGGVEGNVAPAAEAEASTVEADKAPDSAPEVVAPEIEIPTTTTKEEEHEPSIVYLSSDSETTLSVLSPNTTYIIGGIVDKNRHKGLCYKRATERGIPTARLPIGEYMTMASRSVLTVNHVVEIMLAWMETSDWGEAFTKVIPKRKEAKLRINRGVKSEEGGNDGGNEGEQGESQYDQDDGIGAEDREENDPSPREESSGLESNNPL